MGKRKEPYTQFQKRLKDRMKERGITRSRLADAAHLGTGTVDYYFKSGASMPTLDTVNIWAKLLRVDTGYLIGDQETKRAESLPGAESLGITKEAAAIIHDLSTVRKKAFCKFVEAPEFINMLAMLARSEETKDVEKLVFCRVGAKESASAIIDRFAKIDVAIPTKEELIEFQDMIVNRLRNDESINHILDQLESDLMHMPNLTE